METARSAVFVGSTMIDVTLVLLAGVGSTVPEVTVAEFWIVVPEAVPVLTRIVMVSALADAPLASAAL